MSSINKLLAVGTPDKLPSCFLNATGVWLERTFRNQAILAKDNRLSLSICSQEAEVNLVEVLARQGLNCKIGNSASVRRQAYQRNLNAAHQVVDRDGLANLSSAGTSVKNN